MEFIEKAKDKLVSGGGIFTFLRSSISSQISSWIDMGTSFVFFAWVFFALDDFWRSMLSVAVGAVCGGVVNCCINYRFTFHATGQPVKSVAVKYAMVWIGSLLLNMYGTTLFGNLLSRWHFLLDMGFTPDGIFATSRLTISLIVSLAWNFVLQRNFVYRPSAFDSYAIRFIDFFSPHRG
ncbi:MAG: GtrA family protein [Bacteroidales bacterium]|nr:GtrA family protein [Bacteroidales bacterium]